LTALCAQPELTAYGTPSQEKKSHQMDENTMVISTNQAPTKPLPIPTKTPTKPISISVSPELSAEMKTLNPRDLTGWMGYVPIIHKQIVISILFQILPLDETPSSV
jgi:hypothetical protein